MHSFVALAIYLALSVVFFGRLVLGHPGSSYIGGGTGNPHDPSVFMWYLAWWPHALLHGLNPFFTKIIWAPSGFNLTWATSIPGASLLASPITLTAGPVVAYNLLILLAPALAAWTTFTLCRYVTKAFWPSLIGGYLFGFSTYQLGHMLGHLNLVLTFPIPLCVQLVLQRIDDALSARRFTLLLALTLVLQFSFSTEIFATMAIFGVVAVLVALVVLPVDARPRLRSTGLLIVYAYVLAAVVLSPYLYYGFQGGRDTILVFRARPEYFSSSLANFLLPTSITYIGQHWSQALIGTAVPPRRYDEHTAYLGAPLVAIFCLFAARRWRTPSGKLLVILFFLVCVAALGPLARVGARPLVPLPWALVMHLPLMSYAVPVRVTVYAFLIAALVAALWLRDETPSRWTRWALASLAVLFLLPNLGLATWKSDLDTPPFVTRGLYKQYVARGENVLIIPWGPVGNSMLWQAQTGMYFRLAGGYTGPFFPEEFTPWPLIRWFYREGPTADDRIRLQAFLRAHDVRTIIVAEHTPGNFPQVFASLGTRQMRVGGVHLYKLE